MLQDSHSVHREIAKELLDPYFDPREFQKKWSSPDNMEFNQTVAKIARASVYKRLQADPLPLDELSFVRKALEETALEIERIMDPSYDRHRWVQTGIGVN